MNKLIIGALVGLVGAYNNNGKSDTTDKVLLKALSLCFNDNLSERFVDNIVNEIHEEKFKISPNCAFCQAPCGNTSDMKMDDFEKDANAKTKIEMLKQASLAAMRLLIKGDFRANDVLYQAIAYFNLNLDKQEYFKIQKKCQEI